jgi:hypothetical protein
MVKFIKDVWYGLGVAWEYIGPWYAKVAAVVLTVLTIVSLILAIRIGWKKLKGIGHKEKLDAMVKRLRPLFTPQTVSFTADKPEEQELINEACDVLIKERREAFPSHKTRA